VYDVPESFLEAVHPDDRGYVSDQIALHQQGRWDIEYRIETSDQTVRWIHDRGFPVRDSKGQVTLMCGFASDITGQKNREEQCEKSVSSFHSTFEKASVGIVLIAPGGKLIDSNPSLRRLLGYGAGELKSMPFQSVIQQTTSSENNRVEQEISAAKKDFYQLQKQMRRKDGTMIPVNLTMISIRDASGEPNYVIGLIERDNKRDATNRENQ